MSDLLRFDIRISNVSNLRPLEVMFLICSECKLISCQVAELKLVHAERMRIRGFNFPTALGVRSKNLEEPVFSVQRLLCLGMFRELLNVHDCGRFCSQYFEL